MSQYFIPYDVKGIEESIEAIANKLYFCDNLCSSKEMVCNRESGQIPRCLFFEYEGRKLDQKGCVVVGLNPGTADHAEKEFHKDLLAHGQLIYNHILNRFLKLGYKGNFYGPIRDFLNSCKIEGPILWTEVAHCETTLTGKRPKPVPPSRLSTSICSRLYLSEELKAIPEDWLIIAVGKDAFEILLPMCPTKTLIGIPHPAYFEKKNTHKFITRVINNAQFYIEDINSIKSGGYKVYR
jgi:hypothetical protein